GARTATWHWSSPTANNRVAPVWSRRWWRWRTWSKIWWAPCATGGTVPDGRTARVLDETVWQDRERAHRQRVDAFVAPHLARAGTGQAHPVWDFLFTYYSLRPRQLRHWHPGFGVVLSGESARRYIARPGYGPHPDGVAVTEEHLITRAPTVRF